MSTAGYFERIDEHRYKPTTHASGAWNPDEMHVSPLAGLVVHALDRHLVDRPDRGLALSRISFDILGRLGLVVWIRPDQGAGPGACDRKAEEGGDAERR
ncbi:hypothetical protein ACIA8D_29795, partial [Streptomyces sp. NPDC051684]